jgi:hypothetical protein
VAQSFEGGDERRVAAGGIRAEDAHRPKLVAANAGLGARLAFMDQRHSVAVAIALQTHVLRTCPLHAELFQDDDADPACAFAVAADLVRHSVPYVRDFRRSTRELTDLLSETIAAAPAECPQCAAPATEHPISATERRI